MRAFAKPNKANEPTSKLAADLRRYTGTFSYEQS